MLYRNSVTITINNIFLVDVINESLPNCTNMLMLHNDYSYQPQQKRYQLYYQGFQCL